MIRTCNKLYIYITRKKLNGNPDASLARLAPLPICLKLAWNDGDSTAFSQRTNSRTTGTSLDSHQDIALSKLCPQGNYRLQHVVICRPKHNLLPERGSAPVSASWPPTLNDNSCSDNNKCRNSRSKVLNKVKTKSSHVTVMSSQSALGTRLSYVTTQIPCQAIYQGLRRGTTFCS